MNTRLTSRLTALTAVAIAMSATSAHGHCDTRDGPVVTDARKALEAEDITPVLKWLLPPHEAEVKAAFEQVLAVRDRDPQVQALADRFFFETVVRLHRMGEGEPYTGLKPAGTDPGPAVRAADQALQSGSADDLVQLITKATADGIRHRFHETSSRKQHASESVQAGREFVKAYVAFVHYVKGIHDLATGAGHGGGDVDKHASAGGTAAKHGTPPCGGTKQ